MSTITIYCTKEEKTAVINGVSEILQNHYYSTVSPNTNVKYEDEGEAVYRQRLVQLMQDKLCRFEETEVGVVVEFDSTEDAGFAIAENVYHTPMGYSDSGLTYVDPIFQAIAAAFPGVSFEADTECFDNSFSEESHFSYDQGCLTKDGRTLEISNDLEDEENYINDERAEELYRFLLAKIPEVIPEYADDLRDKLAKAEDDYKNDPSLVIYDHPLFHLIGYLLNVAKKSFDEIDELLKEAGATQIELDYIPEDSCEYYFD